MDRTSSFTMRKHSNNPFTILGTKKPKTPKRFRKNYRFTNVRHFIDDGWSGTSFERPSFTEIMDLVGGGKVGNGNTIPCKIDTIYGE